MARMPPTPRSSSGKPRTTREMNPTIAQRESIKDEAMEADPTSASAEYLAEFRSDVESFYRPRRNRGRELQAFGIFASVRLSPTCAMSSLLDPRAEGDYYTWGIAHRGNQTAILDVLREARPPFSPASVSEE